jgi:hypothetical protein
VKEPISFSKITNDDRAEFFARYNNASLGRVKNLYLKWARLKGALSPECQQLNRLFSQCVDGNRIKVPPNLEDPPESANSHEPFILDYLHDASREFIEETTNLQLNFNGYDTDMMDLLLSRDSIAISEFDLIKLTLQWCDQNGSDFVQFSEYFDFSALTDEEKAWLLNRLYGLKDFPGTVLNGLIQSRLLDRRELQLFKLDHPNLHWKPVFDSTTSTMSQFLSTASRSLELFHKKLLLLRVNERLTIAIYVPCKIPKANETQVGASVRVFAFPQSKGNDYAEYRVMPTTVNYKLYCDESNFQLYNLKRSDTWVFLTRSPADTSSYRNLPSEGDRRRQKQRTIDEGINFDCRASIALQKIHKNIQTHVGRLNRAGILAAVSLYTVICEIANESAHMPMLKYCRKFM